PRRGSEEGAQAHSVTRAPPEPVPGPPSRPRLATCQRPPSYEPPQAAGRPFTSPCLEEILLGAGSVNEKIQDVEADRPVSHNPSCFAHLEPPATPGALAAPAPARSAGRRSGPEQARNPAAQHRLRCALMRRVRSAAAAGGEGAPERPRAGARRAPGARTGEALRDR